MSRPTIILKNVASFATCLIQNSQLISQMAAREIRAKYQGSILGVLWNVATPILMLSVYTLVFSVVFKSRWAGETSNKSEFAMLIFSGLIIFNFFAEIINRAPKLILDNPNYVKKVVFPLEALAWVTVLVALFNALISYVVLVLFRFASSGELSWTALIFPALLIPLSLLAVGISWLLSSLGVFLRDIAQLVGILTSVLMFLSPIFYPVDALPQQLKFMAAFNPLTFYLEAARDFLVWGRWETISAAPWPCLVSLSIAILGHLWFARTRHAFADVM
jgi:lipopolysaccharide transport system permease protein